LYKYKSEPRDAKFLITHMFDKVDESSEFPTDRGTWCTFTDTGLQTIAESLSGEQDDRDNGQGGAGKSSGNAKRGRKSGDRGNTEGGDNDGDSNEDGAPQGARVHGNMCGLDVANELDLLDFLRQRGRTDSIIQTPHPALSSSGDLYS
jgi:hypothetical protein